MMTGASVYLIPTFLDEHSIHVLPAYLLDAVKSCQVFFVENERSARRFLKALDKSLVIDQYEWFTIHKAEEDLIQSFRKKLQEEKVIGILSEAGCPGIADPGQILIAAAQAMDIRVIPLVGPSAILLALMASGMNGQQFQFLGYLPIDQASRLKAIRELELESQKKNCTQVFIETPYRNNQLLEIILKQCKSNTRLCIAVDITGPGEFIKTKTIGQWKGTVPDLNKRPAIFLILS
jgi:16S rRNA (cytidine1402-2'-O)-methyltransferase